MKKKLLLGLLVLLTGIYFPFYLWGETTHQGHVSDHFDGKRFHNTFGLENKSLFAAFGTLRTGQWQGLGSWDEAKNADYPPPPSRVYGENVRLTFVNHSTLLMQTQGLNILTDPIWSDYAGPHPLLSPSRYRPPGIAFDTLPAIDVVVVSHSHYDHMDLPSLKRLYDRFQPKIFVGLGNAALLQEAGIGNVHELDWWAKIRLSPDMELIGVPAQHWSRRGVWDKDRRLWLGYVFKSSQSSYYFAGDTAMGRHFEEIQRRYGPIDLALLPIGSYRPYVVMQGSHLSPEQALQAHNLLQSKLSVAIHYGTFRLGLDGQYEAVERLNALLPSSNSDTTADFRVLDFGESLTLPSSPSELKSAAMQ